MAKIFEAGHGRAVRCTTAARKAGIASGTPHEETTKDRMYLVGIGNVVVAMSVSKLSQAERAHLVSELSRAFGHVGKATVQDVQENSGSFALQVTPACENLKDGDSFAAGTSVAVVAPTYEDRYGDEKGLGVIVIGQARIANEVADVAKEMRLSQLRVE